MGESVRDSSVEVRWQEPGPAEGDCIAAEPRAFRAHGMVRFRDSAVTSAHAHRTHDAFFLLLVIRVTIVLFGEAEHRHAAWQLRTGGHSVSLVNHTLFSLPVGRWIDA